MQNFKPKTIALIYIVTSPEKVWEALTSGDLTRQFFFGRRVELEPRAQGRFRLWQPDGTLDVEGAIVTWDPPRQLSVTWRVMWSEKLRQLPECLVTYDVAPLESVVRLTVTESHQVDLDEKALEGGRRGWPVILNSLKTFLETGSPMPAFPFASL